MKDTFYTELQKATDEVSQVQPLYRSAILWGLEHNDYYEYAEKDANGNPLRRPLTVKNELVHVGNTDGIIQSAYLETSLSYTDAVYIEFFMLLECKLDQSFRDTKFTAGVLLQVICYLKQMQDRGDVLFPDMTVYRVEARNAANPMGLVGQKRVLSSKSDVKVLFDKFNIDHILMAAHAQEKAQARAQARVGG